MTTSDGGGSTELVEPDDPDGSTIDGSAPDPRAQRSARAAAITFGVFVLVAFPVLLHLGSYRWFAGDEWGLLAGRSLGLDDLFRPQNRHWSTVPILSYHAIYRVFGLHSYLPYMAVVVALHLTLATLIRTVMRRALVGPWVATIVAGVFVFFGAGHENIFLGVQVSQVGSLVCGFAHLLLADHDGRFDWRDGVGLGFGVVGLMSSGVAPPLVFVVGLAVLIRRGWLMALVHTVPLAAVYGIWYLVYVDEVRPPAGFAPSPPVHVLVDWTWRATSGAFMTLAGFRVVAIALAAMVVVGLFLAWLPLDWKRFRRVASSPLALGLGAFVLIGAIGTQRAQLGLEFARSSRYLAMTTALLLPALAVAANAFVERWRPVGALVLVLVVVGVPWNLDFKSGAFGPEQYAAQRDFVMGVAYSDLAQEVRRGVLPNPHRYLTDQVTVGFLRDALASGRLPDEPELTPRLEAVITNRLRVSQSNPDDGLLSGDFACGIYVEPLHLEPEKGDQFGLRGPVQISTSDGRERAGWTPYDSSFLAGDLLTVEVSGLDLAVRATPPNDRFTWCVPR